MAATRPALAPATQPAEAPPAPAVAAPAIPVPLPVTQDTGYRGQWHAPPKANAIFGYRFSGGQAFSPPTHRPVACYAPKVNKTFFVYAGAGDEPAPTEAGPYRVLISCFDHATKTVGRPTLLLDNLPAGGYGTPALTLDGQGRLWVFVCVIGGDQPGVILRSAQPYALDAFEKVMEMPFHRPQPWYIEGQGFLFVHTRFVDGEEHVFVTTSRDGLAWSVPQRLVQFGHGDICVSGRYKNKVGIALSYRPADYPDDRWTNLYYVETADLGKTWQTFPRKTLPMPLQEVDNAARVRDYGPEWYWYLHDLTFDPMGNPVVLYVLRHRKQPLPKQGTRVWNTARWAIREWEATGILSSDHDYDSGCIAVEKLTWRMVIPSLPGPQDRSPGGDLVRWLTEDQGRSWYPQRLIWDGPRNHNGVRHPVDARDDLFLLWADGDTRKPSESQLYYADKAGNVYVLPRTMQGESAKPALLWKAVEPEFDPPSASQPSTAQPASTSQAASTRQAASAPATATNPH